MGGHHAITGAAAWLALTAALPAVQLPGGLAVPMSSGLYAQPAQIVLLGLPVIAGAALLADADHHSATIAHSMPFGSVITGAIEHAAGGHRKGTHTLWAVAIVGVFAWMLQFLTWNTHGPLGVVAIGAGIATMALTAFATKSIKAVFFINTWPKAWIAGALVGTTIAVLARGDQVWLPVAITVGFAVHLVGDALTEGGIAPLYPLLPKPPQWWQNIPVIRACWQPNGYMGAPVLGITGSAREWLLASVITIYVLYGVLTTANTLL